MMDRIRKDVLCTAVVALMMSPGAFALYEDDVRISSDRGLASADIESAAFGEIRDLLAKGYPVQSVYLHGVARGISIDDLVFLSVRYQPERAARFAEIAIDMLPVLPEWACRDDSQDAANRFAPVVATGDSEPVVSIGVVASKFFEENVRVGPFPDWTRDEAHLRVPAAELLELLGDDYWYRNNRDDRPVNRGVNISLYQHDGSIVVDGNLGQVQNAIDNGEESIPVVVIYNEERQRPVSEFGADPVVGDIVAAYFAERLRLTHVPDWQDPYGDYHTVADIAEFEQFVTLPSREEIDDARWDKITTELAADGFSRKPVIVSMYYNGSRIWVDEADRLTAARELGIEQAPAAYLYHSIDRLACGVAPGGDCENNIRAAAELASVEPTLNQ